LRTKIGLLLCSTAEKHVTVSGSIIANRYTTHTSDHLRNKSSRSGRREIILKIIIIIPILMIVQVIT